MDQVHVIRHKVLVETLSVRRVAREMKVSRNTVRRYLGRPEPKYGPRPPGKTPVRDLAVLPLTDGPVPPLTDGRPDDAVSSHPDGPDDPTRARRLDWAMLMKRAYALDVLVCPSSAGKMAIIAMIDDERALTPAVRRSSARTQPPRRRLHLRGSPRPRTRAPVTAPAERGRRTPSAASSAWHRWGRSRTDWSPGRRPHSGPRGSTRPARTPRRRPACRGRPTIGCGRAAPRANSAPPLRAGHFREGPAHPFYVAVDVCRFIPNRPVGMPLDSDAGERTTIPEHQLIVSQRQLVLVDANRCCRSSTLTSGMDDSSAGSVPPLPRYSAVLGLLGVRLASLRCLRSAVPSCARCSLSRRRARRSRAWACSPGARPGSPDGNGEVSQVPGGPLVYAPRPSTPADRTPPATWSARYCLPLFGRASASATADPISRLNHTARTLAVYASQPGLPPNHARLATGWWLALAGRDWLPAWSR